MSQPEDAKSGRCAIVGRPNVGKSSLLNRVLGQKLAIATPKPQTTRTCILGVYVQKDPPRQIAFVDTPGLHRPSNALGRAALEEAQGSVLDADVILLMAHVGQSTALSDVLGQEERQLLAQLGKEGPKVLLAINKVDRVKDKALLLPLIAACGAVHDFAAIVPISVRYGDNLDALVAEIGARLPEGLRYDDALLTDKPERFFAAELVREAVIRETRQEVPYAVAVVIDEYTVEQGLVRISATIVVGKEAHKGILIGKRGQQLKQIGILARGELEKLVERKVFLKLWIKVIEDWTDNPQKVQELIGQKSVAAD